MQDRLFTKTELSDAIRQGGMVLYYQPLFNLATGRFEAVEALIRWNHARLGLIQPEDFLPAAIEWGLIVEIGYWALNTAAQQFSAWRAQGITLERVAVNVHVSQLRDRHFLDQLQRILKIAKISPSCLELELTEDVVIHDKAGKLIDLMHTLKGLGVQIALDDFGTGYSSISYLRQLPIDRIKIDKSYIQNILHSPKDSAIIQAMITLANSLSLEVVAEGVESYPQLALLFIHLGLEAQGFYFSKPLPADDVGRFLRYYQYHSFPIAG